MAKITKLKKKIVTVGKVKGKKAFVAKLPPLSLPNTLTHVSLATALSAGNPTLDQSRKIQDYLTKQFVEDFNEKMFDTNTRWKLAGLRAAIWWRLFSPSQKANKWKDFNQAKVDGVAFRNLKHHICPLGFKNRQQMASMIWDLHKAIPWSWGGHTIALAGSSTTFYSENPDKTKPKENKYHFFDRKGYHTGDYDLAISFDNPTQVRAALGNPFKSSYGSYWGSGAVAKGLDLTAFYEKWGHHPYEAYPKGKNTILDRDIGIIIPNYTYKQSGTRCSFWKKDYVWTSSTQDFIKPKYGVWYTTAPAGWKTGAGKAGGKAGGGKAGGKAGVKVKGKGK